jgi:hypothetical protein
MIGVYVMVICDHLGGYDTVTSYSITIGVEDISDTQGISVQDIRNCKMFFSMSDTSTKAILTDKEISVSVGSLVGWLVVIWCLGIFGLMG